MIVLDLSCDQDHEFEAWFASSEALDAQLEKSLVACPTCGSTHVRRLPAAPAVNVGRAKPSGQTAPSMQNQAARFIESLRAMASRAEDVGDRFASEARKIHRGDVEEREIKGVATRDEVAELLDEGIDILPVPSDPKRLN